jgi:RNA polymerase nonessential primary-like sigma factor
MFTGCPLRHSLGAKINFTYPKQGGDFMRPFICLEEEAEGSPEEVASLPNRWTASRQPQGSKVDRGASGRWIGVIAETRRAEVQPIRPASVESNLALAAHIAYRYRNRRMPTEDLFHEGVIGLIRAVRYFDPRRGKPFASYAGFWIRKYIREALSQERYFVHVPSHRRFGVSRIEAPRHTWAGERRKHITSKRAAEPTLFRYDDGWIGCHALSPEDSLLLRERVQVVREAVERLTSIEQSIISRRYGLGNDQPQTLSRIASKRGLTRQRVHQIEEKAKSRLRRRFRSLGWVS